MTIRPLATLTDEATLAAILHHPDLREELARREIIRSVEVAIEKVPDATEIDVPALERVPTTRVAAFLLSVDGHLAIEMDPRRDAMLRMHMDGIEPLMSGVLCVWAKMGS